LRGLGVGGVLCSLRDERRLVGLMSDCVEVTLGSSELLM
jgi:hypothetical protein